VTLGSQAVYLMCQNFAQKVEWVNKLEEVRTVTISTKRRMGQKARRGTVTISTKSRMGQQTRIGTVTIFTKSRMGQQARRGTVTISTKSRMGKQTRKRYGNYFYY
jgi:hypothetical protein